MTALHDALSALVKEAEKVGHRGTCPIQPCDCWWKHGLYDAVNAATEVLHATLRPVSAVACTRASLHTAHCSNGEGHPHRDCYCGVYWNDDDEPKFPCPECEDAS